MKTKSLTIIMLLFFAVQGFAQNNDMKARMEFEDAETAYQNQDYSKAVTHLESAEKLLGKPTGKTRYLLILAKANVFSNTEGYEYKDLEKLRGLCKHYLDNYTTDSEKYREIYDLSNVLNKDFPKTEQEYNRIIFEKLKEKQERTKKDMEQKTAEIDELKQAQNYVKSLAQKYGGFVSDITVDEFAKLSSTHQEIIDSYKKDRNKNGNRGVRKDRELTGPSYAEVNTKNEVVSYYYYSLLPYEKRARAEQESVFEEMVKEITQRLDGKYYKIYSNNSYLVNEIDIADIKEIDLSNMHLAIKIPGLDFRGIVLNYHHRGNKGYINIKFYNKEHEFNSYDVEKEML